MDQDAPADPQVADPAVQQPEGMDQWPWPCYTLSWGHLCDQAFIVQKHHHNYKPSWNG